jgi:hypothetical protein
MKLDQLHTGHLSAIHSALTATGPAARRAHFARAECFRTEIDSLVARYPVALPAVEPSRRAVGTKGACRPSLL